MTPLDIETAWSRVASHLHALPDVEQPRAAAANRVLARDLVATSDWPSFDMSAMDGYAASTGVSVGRAHRVGQTLAAGSWPTALEPGTVARIMTGAPVPAGADRVIPFEDSDRGAEQVVFQAVHEPGANIRSTGEVIARGQVALARGTPIGPSELALAASLGARTLTVHRAPRVRLVTTGDEIVAPDGGVEAGQIRDSHTDFFGAALLALGLRLETAVIARDSEAELSQHLGAGLAADVLIVTGGVSAGDFDAVEGVLIRLGCTILFDAVAIRPGKPLVAARGPQGLVFALPGNPASAMVGWWLFVRPALEVLQGRPAAPWANAVQAISTEPLPPGRDRDRFLPARAERRAGVWFAGILPSKGSHDLLAYGRANALLRVRPGAAAQPAGSRCEVLPTGAS